MRVVVDNTWRRDRLLASTGHNVAKEKPGFSQKPGFPYSGIPYLSTKARTNSRANMMTAMMAILRRSAKT